MDQEKKQDSKILFYLLTACALLLVMQAFMGTYPLLTVVPLLKAAALMAAVFVYGFIILSLLRIKEIRLPETIAAGLTFTTFYFYILGFAKIITPLGLYIFYIPPLLLPPLLFSRHRREVTRTLGRFLRRPPAEYAVLLVPLVYAALPSTFYDTLVYHLGIPNLYLQHQGFIPTPFMVYANTAIYYEISLIPAVFAGEMVPRLFHFLLGSVFILTLLDFGAEYLQVQKQKRTITLVTVLSLPLTFFLLSTVKNDLAGAFFMLVGIEACLRRHWVRGAWAWGFAVGIKYFNGLALLLFLACLLPTSRRPSLKGIGIFILLVPMVLLPLAAKNFHFTGDPLYPFLNQWFPGEHFDASRFQVMQKDVGTLIHSVQDFLRLPYTLSSRELGSGGWIGPLLLVFLPFLLFFKQEEKWLLVFGLLYLGTGAFFTGSIRFMYLAVALLALFAARVYCYLEARGKLLKHLFLLVVGLNLVTAFAYHERIYRAHYLYSGKTTVEAYKATGFPAYPAVEYINSHAAAGAGVLLVGEARGYYLKRPYHAASALDYSVLKPYLRTARTAKEFRALLQRDELRYIIYDSVEFKRLQDGYHRLTEEENRKLESFLASMTPVFRQDELYVFEI